MGRRDAVQFTLEWAAEARRLGAIVEFEPGWETRGNGQSANYEGAEIHHTAFLSSQGNPFPAKNTLKTGRVDLGGPLCNVGVPWCEEGSPLLVVIAAHPANHAGASGGRSMGPLPVTTLFNPRVFGFEIDYGGVVPMTKGQYKAALIGARAVVNVLARDTEWIRAHAETSITGKWDPGYAPGKTIDMADFRRAAASASFTSEEDDMTPEQAAQLDRIEKRLLGADVDKRGYDMLQSIEAAAGDAQNRIRGTHPAMDSLQTIQWQVAQVAAALATQRVDVDEKALADQILAGLVPQVVAAVGQQAGLTAEQIADITERVVRGVFADAGS